MKIKIRFHGEKLRAKFKYKKGFCGNGYEEGKPEQIKIKDIRDKEGLSVFLTDEEIEIVELQILEKLRKRQLKKDWEDCDL